MFISIFKERIEEMVQRYKHTSKDNKDEKRFKMESFISNLTCTIFWKKYKLAHFMPHISLNYSLPSNYFDFIHTKGVIQGCFACIDNQMRFKLYCVGKQIT